MEALFLNKLKDLAAEYHDDISGLIKSNIKWYEQKEGELKLNFEKNIQKTLETAQEIHTKDYNINDTETFDANLKKLQESLKIASTTASSLANRYVDLRDKLVIARFEKKLMTASS